MNGMPTNGVAGLEGLEGLAPGARIAVAMSGGVDSAATAALVQAAGFQVIGITLQLYDHGAAIRRPRACCAGADIHDARRIADALGIAHYVLDYEARFRDQVMRPFAEAYLAGETPIPCIECNRTVKFADLLGMARELGAAALATGHYARRVPGPAGPELHRAADARRDQSYFLFATTRQQLDFLRFPLGDRRDKAETRAIAGRFGLAVRDKPDSQDICFVPNGRYQDVVARLAPAAHRPGRIVDRAGREIGRHDGIYQFTVGQRRGLGVSAPRPLYVIAIDAGRAEVTVGPREALACPSFVVRDVNWLAAAPRPSESVDAAVKVRSSGPALPARFRRAGDAGTGATVALARPENAVAPGQAAVFYDGARVIGGGWIARAHPARARTQRAA